MEIIKCSMEDVSRLAAMNKKLIEDEQSDNAMNIEELQNRMAGFLSGDYSAYFFSEQDEIIGYGRGGAGRNHRICADPEHFRSGLPPAVLHRQAVSQAAQRKAGFPGAHGTPRARYRRYRRAALE